MTLETETKPFPQYNSHSHVQWEAQTNFDLKFTIGLLHIKKYDENN